LQSADYNVVPVGGTQALSAAPAAVVKGNKNKKDWEEFYDSSAKAKYWFNKTTGEASWISPF
jgi:GH18 family chitinase